MLKWNPASLFLILALASCSIEQEPIRFGFDSCENCKMLIMDPKFGAVILTKKGKSFKFDDTNCLVAYYKKNFTGNENAIAAISVIDYGNPEKLIDATKANFVSSSQIKSPMASGIAAFSDLNASREFISRWQGNPLTWDEIKVNF